MSTFRSAEERFTTKHNMPHGSRSAVRPPPTPTKTTGTTQPTTLTKAHTRRRTISKSRHGARVKDTAAHTRCPAASMSTTHYANGVLRSHMIASPPPRAQSPNNSAQLIQISAPPDTAAAEKNASQTTCCTAPQDKLPLSQPNKYVCVLQLKSCGLWGPAPQV